MLLSLVNNTASTISLLSGSVSLPASLTTAVTNTTYQYQLATDGFCRQNIINGNISVSDGTNIFGSNDAINYLILIFQALGPVADGAGNLIGSQSNTLNVNTKSIRVFSTPQTATVNTTPTLILSANPNRKGLYLSNTSPQQISFGFDGQTPAYQYGITLFPGEKFWMDEYSFSVGAIYAITTGAATYIGIQEIT